MRLLNRLANLETRVADIDLRINGCNCRTTGSTFYHSARELAAILGLSCPIHGFRDLGDLLWFPAALPLVPEDRHLCTCPPSPTRDWLENKRGPLTPAEQEAEIRIWKQEFLFDEAMRKLFVMNQAEVESLLQSYNREKVAAFPNRRVVPKSEAEHTRM